MARRAMRRVMRRESGAKAIEAKAREGEKARRGEAAEEASTLAAAARPVLLWPCLAPKVDSQLLLITVMHEAVISCNPRLPRPGERAPGARFGLRAAALLWAGV